MINSELRIEFHTEEKLGSEWPPLIRGFEMSQIRGGWRLVRAVGVDRMWGQRGSTWRTKLQADWRRAAVRGPALGCLFGVRASLSRAGLWGKRARWALLVSETVPLRAWRKGGGAGPRGC